MNCYRKLLTEERFEYKVCSQTHVHIEGKEDSIGIKDMGRAIMSSINDRMNEPEGIYAEFLKCGTISHVEQHHQPTSNKRTSSNMNRKWYTFPQYTFSLYHSLYFFSFLLLFILTFFCFS
jgi:hypothetical protein